ncbi:hypothetical protein [Okeania sp. KiyG1]|uniref:hypothetical protein n=1 Tax=Okeania sp. KiyG1 TaxID=2720165 RepID=UPI0019210177|nr:hypothetical protein [Okeania sp. KiyG1]GGA30803.1 hypothetical protein CYANOKiyG1_47420 [Okeania sp. KiyG1]
MEAFSPTPPEWTESSIHVFQFSCPKCGAGTIDAQAVWINRRSPVYGENSRRKWQEFYHCKCGCSWWAWSSDRPPSKYAPSDRDEDECNDLDPFT